MSVLEHLHGPSASDVEMLAESAFILQPGMRPHRPSGSGLAKTLRGRHVAIRVLPLVNEASFLNLITPCSSDVTDHRSDCREISRDVASSMK